jgi:hypothetical protein
VIPIEFNPGTLLAKNQAAKVVDSRAVTGIMVIYIPSVPHSAPESEGHQRSKQDFGKPSGKYGLGYNSPATPPTLHPDGPQLLLYQ